VLRPIGPGIRMEALSTFDIFKIGVGPSSSHTMGPWRAAQRFVSDCQKHGVFDNIASLRCDLYGSLAKTGKGHGTDIAVVLGLLGEDPETCDTTKIHDKFDAVGQANKLTLAGQKEIEFSPKSDIVFHFDRALPFHPNGLTFTAVTIDGNEHARTYYSVGGGFVVE